MVTTSIEVPMSYKSSFSVFIRKNPQSEEVRPSARGEKILLPFPVTLHVLLDEAEANGDDDIVSFYPDGKAFAIHKQDAFTEKVMPRHFKTTRIESFQRQLLLYGFQRFVEGKKVGYYHEFFVKGNKSLSLQISRSSKRLSSGARRLYRTPTGEDRVMFCSSQNYSPSPGLRGSSILPPTTTDALLESQKSRMVSSSMAQKSMQLESTRSARQSVYRQPIRSARQRPLAFDKVAASPGFPSSNSTDAHRYEAFLLAMSSNTANHWSKIPPISGLTGLPIQQEKTALVARRRMDQLLTSYGVSTQQPSIFDQNTWPDSNRTLDDVRFTERPNPCVLKLSRIGVKPNLQTGAIANHELDQGTRPTSLKHYRALIAKQGALIAEQERHILISSLREQMKKNAVHIMELSTRVHHGDS